MNGKLPPEFGSEPESFDPELARLFDGAEGASLTGDNFVGDVVLKIQQTQRRRLQRQLVLLGLLMAAGVWVAPYAAEATLHAAGWISEQVPAAAAILISSVGCLGAALLAWRITRHTNA